MVCDQFGERALGDVRKKSIQHIALGLDDKPVIYFWFHES